MHNRIGLDIDGVFADYSTGIREETIKRYSLDPNEQSIPLELVYRTECSVLDSHKHSFWYKLKPLKLDPLIESWLDDSWRDLDSTIYFITRRPPCLQQVTIEWLCEHFEISPSSIVLSGAVEKGRIAQGLYLNHFVDDDPIHCMQVRRYSPKTSVYLAGTSRNKWFKDKTIPRLGV